MPFTAHHHCTDKLALAALLEAFANDQWIGEKTLASNPVSRSFRTYNFTDIAQAVNAELGWYASELRWLLRATEFDSLQSFLIR